MPLITLTTDFGPQDHYAGVLKGAICRHSPEATIVDISHQVRPFDIVHAALLVRSAWRDFPKGTVHIVAVRPEREGIVDHLAVECSGQWFIAADNGIFPLMLDEAPSRVFNLDHVAQNVGPTNFPSRDIFSMAAAHLSKGGIPEVMGRPAEIKHRSTAYRPVVDSGSLRGIVLHIDYYGNAITNIDRALFEAARRGRPFEIRFRRGQQRTAVIRDRYAAVEEGDALAMFNTAGLLQICVNRGSAAQLMGLRRDDMVTVEFKGEG